MPNTLLATIEGTTLYFEDLSAGERFETSGRTITEADIVGFAGLSGDFNSLHMDAQFAGQTPHGQRIAHGLLVLAMTSGLATRLPLMKLIEKAILGLAGLECKWLKPAFIGDTLHAVVEISSKEPGKKPDRGTLVMKRFAVNQRGETVMESSWRIVLKTRPAQP
ncbi:MAG: MaoC/PaaZ C-terminal domain-containing protein [Burkholderiales bacterium]